MRVYLFSVSFRTLFFENERRGPPTSLYLFSFCDRYCSILINSRTAIAGAIIGLLSVFLQFKEFELYWGAVFFVKICSHIFMIFEVKIE